MSRADLRTNDKAHLPLLEFLVSRDGSDDFFAIYIRPATKSAVSMSAADPSIASAASLRSIPRGCIDIRLAATIPRLIASPWRNFR